MIMNVLSRIGGALKVATGYPEGVASRRAFISYAARNVLLGTSAGYLLWDQAARAGETHPVSGALMSGALSRNDPLEQKILGILGDVQRTQCMSSRYQEFISKVTELTVKREIKFGSSRNCVGRF